VEEASKIESHRPCECKHCGEVLEGEDAAPWRHQVWELPLLRAALIEHQMHRLRCGKCGKETRGDLPLEAKCAFGPRLRAMLLLLRGSYRLSVRQAQKLAWELLGIRISTGAISELEARGGEMMKGPVEELRECVAKSAALHVDETSWREKNQKGWMWVAVSKEASIFKISKGRSRKDSEGLLEQKLLDLPGVVISDRWVAYSNLPGPRRQLCWAHIKRDFQKMMEAAPPGARRKAKFLIKCSRKLFALWRRFQAGRCSRDYLGYQVKMLRISVETILEELEAVKGFRHAGMCREILKKSESLWTFASVPGVRPDNNPAERALRHPVICRRLSGGSQSQRGSRFVERLFSLRASLQQQGRSLWEYLQALVWADSLGLPLPSPLSP